MSATICKCGASCEESHRFCPRCGRIISKERGFSSHPLDPHLGTNIGGKYLLRELIGSGGMGNVYLAEQLRVGRTAAVKIMHSHLLGDKRAVARFINEARAASRLNHPHSISVLDFGQTDEGVLYIVMEYLRGRSLDRVLEEEYPIAIGRVAHIMCQVLDAVEAAHRLNIIHRDLKPENIFLESTVHQDFVKVLDFGVAKILESEMRRVTSPGLVPGTPEYMSPEQARGLPIDHRSDVYSLGVIFYELLTEFVPFKGKSALETMMAHVQDDPVPPSQRRPDRNFPEGLDQIVLLALDKRLEHRIQSAEDFREMLSLWAETNNVWQAKGESSLARPMKQRPEGYEEFFSKEEIEEIYRQGVEFDESSGVEVRPLPPLSLGLAAVLPTLPPVGRDEELGRIRAFVEGEDPGVLVLRAPVGAGKARLVREALRMAQAADLQVIACAADSGWVRSSLRVAQGLASACLGLPREHCVRGPQLAKAVRRIGLAETAASALQALFQGHDLSDDTLSDDLRRELAVTLRDLLLKRAEGARLLLVLEQVEQFDALSQDLVFWLLAGPLAQKARVLLTTGMRLVMPLPASVQQVMLAPLTEEKSQELLASLFELSDPVLFKALAASGHGNPLLLQQAAFARVFEGLLDPPDTVAELLTARIDRLTLDLREVLQWLAVYNDRVSAQTLADLLGQPEIEGILVQLVERLYLEQDEHGFAFFHREAASWVAASIPAEVRRAMHKRIGEHLRHLPGEPSPMLAYHLFEAEEGPDALDELGQAGALAASFLDAEASVQWYSRALDLVRKEWGRGRLDAQDLDRRAVELGLELARALRRADDFLAARGILEEILSVAAGEASSRAALRLELGRLNLDLGHLQRAVQHLNLARADAEAAGLGALKAEVNRQLARATGLLGQKDEAGRMLMQNLVGGLSTQALEALGPTWESLLEAATIGVQIGMPERAMGLLLDALQLAEGQRAQPAKIRIFLQMAELHRNKSEWDMAEMRLNQALNLMRANGLGTRTLAARLLCNLGRIRRIQGDVEQGRRYLDEALQLSVTIGFFEGIHRAEHEIDMLRFAEPKQL